MSVGDHRWTLAPVLVLRHAGLPFDWVESLGAAPAVLDACDALLAIEDELAPLLGAEAAGRLVSALETGRGAKVPRPAREAVARWREAWDRLTEAHAADRRRLRARLRALAGDPRFRDAVFTSNPGMYDAMLAGYLDRDDVPDTARHRRTERQIYSYLQRFCAKNETASAFGPMGYGSLGDGEGLRVEPAGPRRRRAFLTHWAVTELASAAARDKALAPHVPVRMGLLTVRDGDRLTIAGTDTAIRLDATQTRLTDLLAKDGPSSLAALARTAALPLRAVADALRPLLAVGAVLRSFDVPNETVDPLPGLRAALSALPPVPARDAWTARLDELAAHCDRFAAAAGDVEARREALAELEAAFTAATGAPPRRGAGAVYADRLVLFEEASSPFRIEIGTDLAEALTRVLEPALESSAAFGDRVQADHRRRMAKVVREATGPLGFLDYARLARPDGESGGRFSPMEPVAVPGLGGQHVRLDARAFGEPEPGERYALPDVCLAAPDAEAASRGEYRVMVARVHHHLLLTGWLGTFHPDPAAFDRIAAEWLERQDGRVIGLATSRRNKGFYRFPGPRLVFTAGDPDARTDNVPAAACTVEVREGRPVLLDPHGRPRQLYPVLNDLTTYPPFAALSPPSVLHAPLTGETDRHLGRVGIGDACYQRERWTLDGRELPVVQPGPGPLLTLRRLARTHGLPRFVFARLASERKPFLVDTTCPFAADLLAHLAAHRTTRSVRFEEMYPGPDELWLRDASGRYTSELRMQLTRRPVEAA
nr:lantibiotic dehydratase [Streptomyces huiliensis]